MAGENVAIIDSGGANIASLQFALTRLGASNMLTADSNNIRSASHVILPGVGAASDAMQRLVRQNLDELIPVLTQPVLGICLGMQLLAEHSEEHDTDCLGIIHGNAKKFSGDASNRVPNMGWSRLNINKEHELLKDIEDGSWFYFLHSYALPITGDTLATSQHAEPFTAVLSADNFHATQFHPERSAAAGATLLKNFLALRS